MTYLYIIFIQIFDRCVINRKITFYNYIDIFAYNGIVNIIDIRKENTKIF